MIVKLKLQGIKNNLNYQKDESGYYLIEVEDNVNINDLISKLKFKVNKPGFMITVNNNSKFSKEKPLKDGDKINIYRLRPGG